MSKVLPEAKYTKFGEKIRHVIPGPVQCSVACGGRNCKWENPARWPEEDQVIKGVFSSWVIDGVVAMSRPSTEVIEKYNIIKQFKDNNIGSIINLQRPGEHASCGPPLNKESLFTYDPKVFMDNNVFFYNFGWKDYGVTSLETILDMVKVMTFALSEGKVAVHCHAGLGRSGVLIACYLVYARRLDASEAINTVRAGRPNSIQTRGQIACIQEFAQYLKPLRIVFPQVAPNAERLTLEQFLRRQRHLLHGFESKRLRHLPKLISVVCERLIEIGTASPDSAWYDVRVYPISKPRSAKKKKGTLKRSNTVEAMKETAPGAFVNDKLEADEYAESVESQEIDAILSPRFTRRRGSARSRASSETKSQSRPESPTDSPDIATEVEIPTDRVKGPSRKSPTTPILVSRAPLQSVSLDDHDGSIGKIPGSPNVVLVKQGSRPKILSATPQMQADANSNNNNRSRPVGNFQSKDADAIISGQVNATTITSDPDSDSFAVPTPSSRDAGSLLRKPALMDRSCDDAAGGRPTATACDFEIGDVERQAEYSEPADQLGCVTLAVLAGDSIISNNDDVPLDVSGDFFENTKATVTKKDLSDAVSIDVAIKEIVNDLVEEVTEGLLDDDAEIIPEIAHGSNFESSDKVEVTVSETCQCELLIVLHKKLRLGQVMLEKLAREDLISSKVGWSEADNDEDGVEKEELRIPDGNRSDGRTTPLMYRAGKTLDLIDSTLTDIECEPDSSMVDVDDDDFEEENELSGMSLAKPAFREGKRPKSAGFLMRLAEKNRHETGAVAETQSLYDLRGAGALSVDDLESLKSRFDPEVFSAASSESKSGDEVASRTGSAKRRIKDPISVATALAYKLTTDEWMWEKVYINQVELNTREGAWSSLGAEDDVHVLAALMWSWIEHLSRPLLARDDVETLIKHSRPDYDLAAHETELPEPALFEKALSELGKPVSSSLQCIFHCLSSLPPLPLELELSVIKRCAAAFTQSGIANGNVATKEPYEQENVELLVTQIQNYVATSKVENAKKNQSLESGSSSEGIAKRALEPILGIKASELVPSSHLKTEYRRGDEIFFSHCCCPDRHCHKALYQCFPNIFYTAAP